MDTANEIKFNLPMAATVLTKAIKVLPHVIIALSTNPHCTNETIGQGGPAFLGAFGQDLKSTLSLDVTLKDSKMLSAFLEMKALLFPSSGEGSKAVSTLLSMVQYLIGLANGSIVPSLPLSAEEKLLLASLIELDLNTFDSELLKLATSRRAIYLASILLRPVYDTN